MTLGRNYNIAPYVEPELEIKSDITIYQDALTGLVGYCNDMELAIEWAAKDNLLEKKTLKRLDKSITVMKVAFKIIKKALKKEKIAKDD